MITFKADGKEDRFVTKIFPFGVYNIRKNTSREEYVFRSSMVFRQGVKIMLYPLGIFILTPDPQDRDGHLLIRPLCMSVQGGTLFDSSPVNVVTTKTGCLRLQAHCSTM